MYLGPNISKFNLGYLQSRQMKICLNQHLITLWLPLENKYDTMAQDAGPSTKAVMVCRRIYHRTSPVSVSKPFISQVGHPKKVVFLF